MRPRAFYELWSLAVELAPTTGHGARFGPASTFDCSSVGLLLEVNEGRYGYDSTPLNADTFAHTGGDGVHFSLLILPERSPEDFPVVMTVPMAETCNFIVGGNLAEFLSLGCRYGYFALEQLAYFRDRTIEQIESELHADGESGSRDGLLGVLRDRLRLESWRNVRARLNELHTLFHPFVRLARDTLE